MSDARYEDTRQQDARQQDARQDDARNDDARDAVKFVERTIATNHRGKIGLKSVSESMQLG